MSTFKETLKDEIVRLRSIQGDLTKGIIISHNDYRLLAEEISNQETFEDVTIVVDDMNILAGKDMPIVEGKRFEPINSLI